MSKHTITKFVVIDAAKYYDPYSNIPSMAIHFRGEYRDETFLTHSRCSPEMWEEESEMIISSALKTAEEFVKEEEEYGYFDETDKETD